MKKLILFLMFIVICGQGIAEGFTLPENLQIIEDSAFEGCEAADEVILNDALTDIGDSAFASCTSLYDITVPQSVTAIGDDLFSDVDNPLLITTTSGSAAMSYALANQLDFDAGTTCRALLIGNYTYSTGYGTLYGPPYDIQAIATTLSESGLRSFSSTNMTNLTADEILSAVSSTFSSATSADISLFYYAGHGYSSSDSEKNGALVGADGTSYVYATDLRTALDAVPGRKIVIIDACYSGALISRSLKSSVTQDPAVSFLNTFMQGSGLLRRSNLAADQYFVMTASAGSQESYEIKKSGQSMGIFSKFFSLGMGYDREEGSFVSPAADDNGDSIVTFAELYDYVSDSVGSFVETYSKTQSVQVYPDDCNWFGIKRP